MTATDDETEGEHVTMTSWVLILYNYNASITVFVSSPAHISCHAETVFYSS